MDGWLLSSSFFQPCAYLPAKTTIFNIAKFIKSSGLLERSAVNEAGPTASQIFYWSGPQLCNGRNGVAKRKSSRRYASVSHRTTENLNSGSAFQSSHITEQLNSTGNCFKGIQATLLSTHHRWLHWSDFWPLPQKSWPATYRRPRWAGKVGRLYSRRKRSSYFHTSVKFVTHRLSIFTGV